MKKQFSRVMMIAGIVACTLFSVSTYAQQSKHTPEEKAKKMTDSLKSSLSLTDAQYSKVYDLNVNYITKMQTLRQQTGTKDEKMQSFKDLRKARNKDLEAALTQDQLVKYKATQKEKKQERKHHHQEKETSQS
jgi:hypothetical protein